MSEPAGTLTILTGLISIDGVPVVLCDAPCCDVGNCERIESHPGDRYGHVCEACVGRRFHGVTDTARTEEQK